jgi:diguanylate cyclase (GGDEF)-like protein
VPSEKVDGEYGPVVLTRAPFKSMIHARAPRRNVIAVLERQFFQTMPERIRHIFGGIPDETSACAPINDDVIFGLMLQEAARLVLDLEEPDLLLVLDAGTLARLENSDAVLAKAARSVLLCNGADGNALRGAPSPTLPPSGQTTDSLFLLLSSRMSLALFAHEPVVKATATEEYSGGWTVQRSTVLHLAEILFGPGPVGAFAPDAQENPSTERISLVLMRLSMHYAHAVQSREKDMRAEHSELRTVLEILKAISSKRHAHDILFVFVEQVARTVATKRCSVVRVWAGNDYAQVLASHENSALFDQRISLEKYPELRLAIGTGKKVVVNDVHADTLTASLSPAFKEAGIDALVVIPIVCRDLQVGTLLLRAAREGHGFSFREISFLEVIAEAASNALERAQLLETVQLANVRLEGLATTDPLTGLHNRRHFQERMNQEVERAARYGLPLSCLMLDADNFKRVNDTWGHLTGDAVLRGISARMQQCVRRVDFVARYGGEEFVIILPQTGACGAVTEAERMRAAIGDAPIDTLTGPVSMTASIGVAEFDPKRMRTSDDLIGSADNALRRAKQLGKNRVVLADNREGKP